MITIDNILNLSIYLFFPLSIYLNYLTYVKSLELKEKSIFLEFALYCSLILMIRYNQAKILLTVFYNIPLIISLTKKNYKTSLLITIIILLSQPKLIFLNLLKYICYFLIFLIPCKDKIKYIEIILIEFTYLLLINNQSSILLTLIMVIIYYLYIHLTQLFIDKGNKIIDLNKVLKELNHEKLLRSSISKLTHELKNPIAVCNGYLEMLNLSDKEKSEKYISIITNEITRSKTIIDEFSNYGKLTKIDKEEMDLVCLFDDINELLEPLFTTNKATLTVSSKEEIYIEGDYNKLKQVFINLLKNTLEAKSEKVKLQVQVTIKEQKSSVKITVKDNGIGMTKETLNRVSEIFYTTKTNGTGLGLAYSKEVIELHKGSLKIDSTLNVGTTITITLPKEKKSEDFNNKNY